MEFSTQDRKRSQLMARMVARIYNGWSSFTRMSTGVKQGKVTAGRGDYAAGLVPAAYCEQDQARQSDPLPYFELARQSEAGS